MSVPCGWFSLLDEEGQVARILVFDSQVDGINALINDHEKWLADDSVTPGDLREKYFNNMGYRPAIRDIELLMDNVKHRDIGH